MRCPFAKNRCFRRIPAIGMLIFRNWVSVVQQRISHIYLKFRLHSSVSISLSRLGNLAGGCNCGVSDDAITPNDELTPVNRSDLTDDVTES